MDSILDNPGLFQQGIFARKGFLVAVILLSFLCSFVWLLILGFLGCFFVVSELFCVFRS